jgi:hypothetical protein
MFPDILLWISVLGNGNPTQINLKIMVNVFRKKLSRVRVGI